MNKITVVDTIMGGGKTTWAIEYMNRELDENILYVSPFLEQDDRIKKFCSEYREFQLPQNKGNGKLSSINELFLGQADIATTHELFKHLDDESRKNIREGQYTLILDETLDAVSNYKTMKNDISILKESDCIRIDLNGVVTWNPLKQNYESKYDEIKELAESHCLMCVNDTVLIWRYPPEIFSLFKKVYILTYLFEGSILKAYFDMYQIGYVKKSVRRLADGTYELEEYCRPDTRAIAKLLHLYDGNLNESWRQKPSALSMNWFKDGSNKNHVQQLKKNIYNYFHNIRKAKTETIMWTTFKDYKGKLKGDGYTKRFVSFNCRSTNEYSDTYNLAYVVNVFVNPEILHFFNQRGFEVDRELYALAEMLQWIWRSRIRNGQEVYVYIASKRMRELLLRWMKNEHLDKK